MKTTHIFLGLALSGLMMVAPTQAQSAGYDFTQDDAPAGYDFTDEEAAADAAAVAEQHKKELQTLIYNGAQYLSACRKAYQEDIVWPVSACCDGIIGNEDFVVIGKRRTCCGASFTSDAGVDRHDAILLGICRDGRVVVIAGCDKEGQ